METAPRDGSIVLVRFAISAQLSSGERIVTDALLEARYDPAIRRWRALPDGHPVWPARWRPRLLPPTPSG
ncbi:hypothetical protein [Muricoccus radiodurans]|uniref:hypothetical protein n=1 Tax=Muricoccus radiodurans TaxID=2231721 RepID=UPI003CEF955D